MKSKIASVVLSSLFLAAVGAANAATESCFWMENVSGEYYWVPAEIVTGYKPNKSDCFKLDSCDGGLGYSNGGCYKWATGPSDERQPWDFVDDGQNDDANVSDN